MKQSNQSIEETFTFDEFIKQLKFKVINDINNQRITCKKIDDSLQKNETTYKHLSYIPDIVGIFEILTMLSIVGLGLFLGYQSYLIPNTISLLTFTDKFSSFMLLLLSITCFTTTSIIGYNFTNINKTISHVLDKLIVNPLKKHLSKKNKILENNLETSTQKLSILQETLKNLTETRDDFKYMIHSSLKDKSFSQNEVNLIYQQLTPSNINALIYLLYHDDLPTIQSMSPLEKEKLSENLKLRISKVKEYSEQLKANAHSQENARMHRVERFHTYPYDDMIADMDNNLEVKSTTTHR